MDKLVANPPEYLKDQKISAAAYDDIEDQKELDEVRQYVRKVQGLQQRVIRARKIHHTKFFSMDMDYGHQHYLDKLSSDHFAALCALEKIELHAAEVMYKDQKWFEWVKERQDAEESRNEQEKKKIQKEAAMFKRHVKHVNARMRILKDKENRKRQNEFLEKAYQERMLMDEDDERWDPIEDAIENERDSFLDLIRSLLWLENTTADAAAENGQQAAGEDAKPEAEDHSPVEQGATKKKKKKKSKAKPKATESMEVAQKLEHQAPESVKSSMNESREEMRRRLAQGTKYNPNFGESGMYVVGTINQPAETFGKTAPMPTEAIDDLEAEVVEIRALLFCRLLLSYPKLFPLALRADSIEQFLQNTSITLPDLRDVCLRLEQPTLQEIRDACADLSRSEEEESQHMDDELELRDNGEAKLSTSGPHVFGRPSGVPKAWLSKREKWLQQENARRAPRKLKKNADQKIGGLIDFGQGTDETHVPASNLRVKVCGRQIYNYPSDSPIGRGGWLQFSVVAKDSSLYDAIELCRHWNEFYELNVLALYGFFPNPKWPGWGGDRPRQQLLEMVSK